VRERTWLSRMLTVLSVITSVVILGAVPAHAERINLTEGINPSAHSLTTHDGTVITGITFVSEKDRPGVRQQQARSATQQTAAAGPTLQCDATWHFITAGGTNAYWKTGVDGYRYIYTNGNRNADYWNQEYIACWWTDWEFNAYAFFSNGTGAVVAFNYGAITPNFQATLPLSSSEFDFNLFAKMFICYFDGNWIHMRLGNSGYLNAWRDPWGIMEPSGGPLNGNNLFKVDPVLVTLYC
jgi:hypothetical protein